MGYFKHHTIVVTDWRLPTIDSAHKKAKEIFNNSLISEIVEGIANTQYSFFIAPDGSKEGWEPSNDCNDKREEFLNWLNNSKDYCDYIEVVFGGDDEYEEITRSNSQGN